MLSLRSACSSERLFGKRQSKTAALQKNKYARLLLFWASVRGERGPYHHVGRETWSGAAERKLAASQACCPGVLQPPLPGYTSAHFGCEKRGGGGGGGGGGRGGGDFVRVRGGEGKSGVEGREKEGGRGKKE